MRIIIAENQAATRRALVLLLESLPDQEVIGEVENQDDLLDEIKGQQPDLVILDGDLPDGEIRKLVSTMRGLDRHLGIIVLQKEFLDERQILEAGADALVLKSSPPKKLLLAIETIRDKEKRN